MSHMPLEVIEGNDPSIIFTCYDVDSSGVRSTANLTDATIECYVKDNPSTSDGAPGVTLYSTALNNITITNATGGKCRVDFEAAAFENQNVSYYHLDVIRAGRRLTYAYGAIKKVNV